MSCDETAKPARPAAQSPRATVIVSVCTTCRSGPADEEVRVGTLVFDAVKPVLNARAPDVLVRPVQCLGVCKRPTTVAVSGPDGYTFVFADLSPDTAPAALATFVEQYRNADHGSVPWRARPEVLRRGLVARIPSAAWSPEDGRPPP